MDSKSMLVTFFLVLSINCCEITCKNFTEKYASMNNRNDFQSRQSRLLSFNTDENGDVTVELAFNVPFVRIPVKKSLDMAKGAVANINLGAVVLAGAMVVITVFLLPAGYLLLSKKMATYSNGPPSMTSYRNIGDGLSSSFLGAIEKSLEDNDISTRSCAQRIICWTVKNSSSSVANGNGTSTDKIIDGLATNEWFSHLANGTSILLAIQDGLKGHNCSKKYDKCKLNNTNIYSSIEQFIQIIADYIN